MLKKNNNKNKKQQLLFGVQHNLRDPPTNGSLLMSLELSVCNENKNAVPVLRKAGQQKLVNPVYRLLYC